MARSLKSNILYNVINAAVSFLFPIITLPYVSRVLLADGLGQIDFYTSIISYVVLATSLGIPLYGIREVARCRDDKEAFNKTTAEIYILQNILSVVGYIVIAALCLFYDKVQGNKLIFCILSLTIGFNAIGAQWFFQAVEDFKYIAIRALCIKILCIICIFIFVKSREDILIYAIISVSVNLGNALFNVSKLFSYLDFKIIKKCKLDIKRHIAPALKIFSLNLTTSLYNYLNVFLLGVLACNEVVGYFSTPLKFLMLLLGITSIISTVLIPRFSNIVNKNDKKHLRNLGGKVFYIINMIVFPLSIGVIILSEPLIIVFCGDSFIKSINVTRIVAPIIFFIGNSGMIGLQFLFPQGKENIVIKSTLVGALVSITLNLLLIPHFQEIGAAIATMIAEFAVLTIMIAIGHKHLPVSIIRKNILQILVSTSVMALVLICLLALDLSQSISLISGITLGLATYLIMLLVLKNEMIYYIIKEIKRIIC